MTAESKLRELRDHYVEALLGTLQRPSMYAACHRDLEISIEWRLDTLKRIDGFEPSVGAFKEELSRRGIRDPSTGIQHRLGQLIQPDQRPWDRNFFEWITSLYAPFVHRCGYLELASRLTSREWRRLRRDRPRDWRESDVTFEEVVDEFGTPSFRIGGSRARVLIYVGPSERDDWIALHSASVWDDASQSYDADPALSVMCLPTKSFSRGLVFTPYGRKHVAR